MINIIIGLVCLMGVTSGLALLAIAFGQIAMFYAMTDIAFACLVMMPILGIIEHTKPITHPRGASRRV
jgi:uncharacterized membrane protein